MVEKSKRSCVRASLSLFFFLMEWKVKSLAENIVRVEFARGGV